MLVGIQAELKTANFGKSQFVNAVTKGNESGTIGTVGVYSFTIGEKKMKIGYQMAT